jgi:hypothetical protein
MLGRSHENPLDNQHVVTLDKLVVRLFPGAQVGVRGMLLQRPFLIPLLPRSYLTDAVFLWKPQEIRVFMGSYR